MAERADQEAHAMVRTRGRAANIVFRIFAVVVVGALIFGGYVIWERLQRVESTDDAQVDGQIHAISSRIDGHVLAVPVEDEQYVNAGDVLVRLDAKDYEVAVARARADLADALATLQSLRTDVPITAVTTASTLSGAKSAQEDASFGVNWAQQQLGAARARLVAAQANVRGAEAAYTKAAEDLKRYKMLVDKDEVSKQQYDQAISAADSARAGVAPPRSRTPA